MSSSSPNLIMKKVKNRNINNKFSCEDDTQFHLFSRTIFNNGEVHSLKISASLRNCSEFPDSRDTPYRTDSRIPRCPLAWAERTVFPPNSPPGCSERIPHCREGIKPALPEAGLPDGILGYHFCSIWSPGKPLVSFGIIGLLYLFLVSLV